MLRVDMGGDVLNGEDITIKVLRVGQEHCDPNKRHENRRWENKSSLHFVLYGNGILIANGKRIVLSKGDVFLLFADEEYEYFPGQQDPWSYIWVDFTATNIGALFAPCGLSVQKPYLHLSDLTSFMALLRSTYEAYDASDVQQMECSAYFMLLLAELTKRAESKRLDREYSSAKHRRVREILTYINNNYRLPLTVQDIATQNHLSVSRMMALFSEVVGMSPIAYLNCFRVSAACDLLKRTETPIGEVGNEVGVEDRLYFSRLFKKWKGVSPRDYRAAGGESDPYAWLKEMNIDFR